MKSDPGPAAILPDPGPVVIMSELGAKVGSAGTLQTSIQVRSAGTVHPGPAVLKSETSNEARSAVILTRDPPRQSPN